MELLIFLVSRRDQLVTRKEIVDRLWGRDLFLESETNLNNIVRKVRTALHDDADQPRYIETVVGKGYRFVGPVRLIDAAVVRNEPVMGDGISSGAKFADACSLAIAPPVFRGRDTDDGGLCLGIADGLVTRLGNLQRVSVLPASAVLQIDPNRPASEIAASLGVRFVVHGVVEIVKGRVQLVVEMYDASLRTRILTRKVHFAADRLSDTTDDIANEIANKLRRPLRLQEEQNTRRHSKDPLAYAEFIQGYRQSSSGDPLLLEEATRHLTNAVARDPEFALAHAILSYTCAAKHFEFDPSRTWLEKAEFHCERALELSPNLAEAHVAKAFLLWGPSKNFQHLEAIGELKRALALQKNLPHAYNRLGTILAHLGLLDQARSMYERGSAFDPKQQVSHSIVQVYLWGGDYDLAKSEIQRWRRENPANKYAIYFAPQPQMQLGELAEAQPLLTEALELMPDEPMIVSLQGVMHALRGEPKAAMQCMNRACANPKSFGHAHHAYYQIACILSILQQMDKAFEWLERTVETGFACWPLFQRDPWLKKLRSDPRFELLVSSLQAKYGPELLV